jgi:hypothetical protein
MAPTGRLLTPENKERETALRGPSIWEDKGASFFAVKGVVVPIALSVFPDELYPAPRMLGGAGAWEQPKLLSEEVREGFRFPRK